MKILWGIIYTVIISITATAFVPAQLAGAGIDQIGLKEGLSQSTVTSIVQDARGFIWFGTQDGLNRYDGYSIKVYMHDPADSNSISDNGIWCLLSDSRGNLWIGTERGGLNRYVYSENKFYHCVNDSADPFSISDNYILSLFEDSNNNIWIGTHSAGLCRYNRALKTFTHIIFIPEDDTADLPGNSVRAIGQDGKGNLWAATGRGLFRIDASDLNSRHPHFTQYRHEIADPDELTRDNINSLYFDHEYNLWVGTWGAGIYGFNITTGTFRDNPGNVENSTVISHSLINSIITGSPENGQDILIGTYDSGLYCNIFKDNKLVNFLDDNILSLYRDRSGILWIGTFGNGVKVFDKRKNKFIHHYDNPGNSEDLRNNAVIGMLLDKDGELWVATLGNVLHRYNKNRQMITPYKLGTQKNDGSGRVYICTLSQSPDGNIWIGTISGGIYCFNKKSGKFGQYMHIEGNKNSLLSNDVATLYYDKESGVLRIGYLNGGMSSFDLTKKTFKHFYPDDGDSRTIPVGLVTTIYTGKHTGLWVGIAEKGVVHFLKHNNSFRRFTMLSTETGVIRSNGISNNYVFSIYEDDKGIVWMGTKGGGLDKYNPLTGAFKKYTVADGLPNNVVYGIEPDKLGSLWLSTDKGLSRFDPSAEKFRNYDTKDGLQSDEFSEQAHFAAPNGELFFGGVNGFNAFHPEEIEDNNYVHPVYLTNFKVFDKTLALSDPLPGDRRVELSYSQNFFSFEFVALNYTLPEKNQYAYTLEGFDSGWHYVTAINRQASYTNLNPGEYILHVKASNNDGLWNKKGTSIRIIVKPPYWMTLWFQVPLGMLVLMILVLLYRYRVKKLLEVERIRSSIALDLHDEIGSTLTEIALYTDVSLRELHSEITRNKLNGRFTKIESLLESIGKTSRILIDAMNDIVWAVDPKNDSLELFLLRIKTQTAQMLGAKGIDHKIDIGDRVTSLHLPLMHRRQIHLIFREALNNIIRHAAAKNVEVMMKKEGRWFFMIITDDGIGIDNRQLKKGNGLNNMKKRVSLLNGSLEIKPGRERGTEIKLTVDLN